MIAEEQDHVAARGDGLHHLTLPRQRRGEPNHERRVGQDNPVETKIIAQQIGQQLGATVAGKMSASAIPGRRCREYSGSMMWPTMIDSIPAPIPHSQILR